MNRYRLVLEAGGRTRSGHVFCIDDVHACQAAAALLERSPRPAVVTVHRNDRLVITLRSDRPKDG